MCNRAYKILLNSLTLISLQSLRIRLMGLAFSIRLRPGGMQGRERVGQLR